MKRDPASLNGKMEHLVRTCRAAGMKVTPQRLAVYRVLLESEDHPSPDALYERVRRSMPSLSLATIYKSVNALIQLGVVQEVSAGNDAKSYDANLEKHHHLVCSECRQVRDLYDEDLDAIVAPRRLRGFVARSVSVQVLGVCADCAKRARG